MYEKNKIINTPLLPGDTVYEPRRRGYVQEYVITEVRLNGTFNSLSFGWQLKDGKGSYSRVDGFPENMLGDTVFLCKKDADDRLMKSDEGLSL